MELGLDDPDERSDLVVAFWGDVVLSFQTAFGSAAEGSRLRKTSC